MRPPYNTSIVRSRSSGQKLRTSPVFLMTSPGSGLHNRISTAVPNFLITLNADMTQYSTPTTTKPVVTDVRGGAPLAYDLKTIEGFAALTSFTDRPVLLALEAAHVLPTTLHDSPVAVVEHSSSGIDTVIREFGKLRDLSAAVRINVASTEHGAIQILCDS